MTIIYILLLLLILQVLRGDDRNIDVWIKRPDEGQDKIVLIPFLNTCTIFVSHCLLQVLRGADRNIDVVIKRPDGGLLAKHLWTNSGTTDVIIEQQGK